MNRKHLVTCFVSLFLVPVAGVSMSSANERASASPTAASSAEWSDGDDVSLPAGVSAEWWAQAQTAIRRLKQPNPDLGAPVRLHASWKAHGDQENAAFGYSVGTAGDVNGDGYDDVIVGAVYYDNDEDAEGRAFAYYGSASGLSLVPDWTAESNQANAHFGGSVDMAGDVNGDGYDDVIIGAQDYDNGQTDEGRAFVYYGSASGLSLTPDWTAESNQAGGAFGADFGDSVGTAGDVNADGYDDVIVGAPRFANGQTGEGRAYVYFGSGSGLSFAADWTAESNQSGAYFGRAVGTAGDVNGDGYDDVIIAAQTFDNGQLEEGRAFVYYGSASGLSLEANWTAESNQLYGQFGYSVGTAGDVNGDGYDDIIVGAPFYEKGGGQGGEGWVFVYQGSASGLDEVPDWTTQSNQFLAHLGWSGGTAGDVNGDGYDDVIVGASGYDHGQADEGRALVYHGSASGLSLTPNRRIESNQGGAGNDVAVGTAGDVNGDGYDDVIVGAPTFDNDLSDEGGAFVFHGRPGMTRPR